MVEEFCRSNRSLAEAEAQSRTEVERAVGSLKQEIFELTEKFKESEAGLKSAETQAEDQDRKSVV